ncbi:MAG: D-glycero-beta-D-manno-heptose 1-phosphate adenylyltransferase [Deltaproteobacteria bacterium]|jgi:rfaE bifunctional protein nucleotidyltransferase chain/domain|nr:D-glycero-beta-D-manno-heptose 1-phosphate adenylyltransferase [Deltaproteobacteria bacterium]
MKSKLLLQYEAAAKAAEIRGAGGKVVFTNGCFDILHPGHLSYLAAASTLGSALFVGLNSDDSTTRLKGPKRPLNGELDRAFMLAGLGVVDHVIIFTDDTPLSLINAIMPDVLVKGGDWRPEDIVGGEETIARGGKVVSLPFATGYSTTDLINRIVDRYSDA